jgi:hypothetical protein
MVGSARSCEHTYCVIFARVGDPSRESREVLKAGKVMKQVARLDNPATIITVENVVEASRPLISLI